MPGLADHQTRLLAYLALGAVETIDEISGSLTLTRRDVSDAAGRLIVRGYAERLDRGVFQATPEGCAAHAAGERLTSGPRGPLAKPRRAPRDTIRQRAWTAMRVLKRFALADLVVAARKAGEPDPSHNLGCYVRALAAGGIVVPLPVRADDGVPTSNGLKVYRLLRDTGQIAPQWRETSGSLYLPDTREILPCVR